MYDGLLLDHDGVVVTLGKETVLNDAARDAFRDAGVPDPDPDAVETLSIAVSEAALLRLARRYEVDPDRLWEARDDRIQAVLAEETATGRKHPYDDTDHLRSVEAPMGVVSNNQTRIVEDVLTTYDLRELFDTVRAREPTRASLRVKKPEPDYLEAAMADLGVENPLYVGDSKSDVVAGHEAGVDTAFIRRPHNRDRTLDRTPTYEVGGLDEVVALVGS